MYVYIYKPADARQRAIKIHGMQAMTLFWHSADEQAIKSQSADPARTRDTPTATAGCY